MSIWNHWQRQARRPTATRGSTSARQALRATRTAWPTTTDRATSASSCSRLTSGCLDVRRFPTTRSPSSRPGTRTSRLRSPASIRRADLRASAKHDGSCRPAWCTGSSSIRRCSSSSRTTVSPIRSTRCSRRRGLPVLFHTGHSGIGTGSPGGGGVRLKYGHPMPIDDVAVDFPELKIIMAHPVVPLAGRGDIDLPAQALGLHRSLGMVAEVLLRPTSFSTPIRC